MQTKKGGKCRTFLSWFQLEEKRLNISLESTYQSQFVTKQTMASCDFNGIVATTTTTKVTFKKEVDVPYITLDGRLVVLVWLMFQRCHFMEALPKKQKKGIKR